MINKHTNVSKEPGPVHTRVALILGFRWHLRQVGSGLS